MNIIRLTNWRFQMVLGGLSQDKWSLSGIVFRHPNFENGEYIHLSKLIAIAFNKAQMTVSTKNNTYLLEDCADGNVERQIGFILEQVSQ